MRLRWLLFATLLGLACPAASMQAGEMPGGNGCGFRPCDEATRDAIYERFNEIAFLEAHPVIDDGVKGPRIDAAQREIYRLNASLARPQWPWPVPCCYRRKPLVIR